MSNSDTGHSSADFEPSFGGGAQLDAAVHPNFSIGAFGRVLSATTEGANKRMVFFDFALAPRARFPFPLGEHWGAAFLEVALGVGAVDLPAMPASATVNTTTSTSPVFLAGAGAGLQLLLTSDVGLMFELGWHHHFFSHTVTITDSMSPSGLRVDADIQGGQLMLQAGLLAAL